MRSSVSGIQIPTTARLNIDGEFTLDAAAGTSGYMLVSQGAGNTPAWSNTLTSPTITTSLLTGSTTFNLLTTTATTINFGSAATTMNIATNNVAKTINLGTGGSGGNQVDVNIGTNASATTSNINLYGQTVLGKSTTSTTTVSGFSTLLQTQGTINTGTTGNATGSSLQIVSGAASLTNASNITGTATSGNLILDAGSASVASIDAVAAYGNIQIGPSSASAITIGNSLITTTVNGTLTANTINATSASTTTADIFGNVTTGTVGIADGLTTGTLNIGNGSVTNTSGRTININTNASGTMTVTTNIGSNVLGGTINLTAGSSGGVVVSGGGLTLPAGTSSLSTPPLKFTTDSSTVTATQGGMHYDGNALLFTNNSSGPGKAIIPARHMVFSQGNSSTSTNTTQSVFPTTYDVLSSLEAAKLYRFRAKYYSSFTYAGSTGGINILFAFSNAPTAIKYSYRTYSQTGGTTSNTSMGTYAVTTSSSVVPGQTASGTWVTEIDGYFTTHATLASTFTPQFISTATTSSSAVMQAGSYIEVEKLGASGATVIAGNWA